MDPARDRNAEGMLDVSCIPDEEKGTLPFTRQSTGK
jgi:hypothetical protein